jgi:tetratricopeptide (TPR) repeat protein
MADAEGERIGPGAKRPRLRKPRAPSPLPDTPDPVEIAMSQSPPDIARLVLEKQARLIDADIRHRSLQIGAERLTIGLRGLLGLAGLAIALGLATMAWKASQSRGWVVESFQVPPALAQQGLTGEVVASKLIDRVTAMRAATQTARTTDSLESGWRNDYRVEIPQTGISVGDVQAALRRWLGNDIRIGGELTRTAPGLALTVRSDRGSATVAAAEGELDALIEKAADAIYSKNAPYLHAIYIKDHGRGPEALAALRRLASADVNDTEKAWALLGVGSLMMSVEGRCADAVPVLQRSHRLDPTIANSVALLATAHDCLGQNQAELDAYRAAVAIGEKVESSSKDRKRSRLDLFAGKATVANRTGDYRGELALYEQAGTDRFAARASALARLGDVRGSRAMLRQFAPDPVTDNDRRVYWLARHRQALATQDWAAAVLFGDRAWQLAARGSPDLVASAHLNFVPQLALVRARAGDAAGAGALLRHLPQDCYACARGRAGVAEINGNRAAADRWFAQAVRLGPRLPFAWQEWGAVALARGDAEGALGRFDQALKHGPQFPLALKGRADALAALQRYRDASNQYSAAARRAPRWGGLYLNWGLSLLRSGRPEAARRTLRAASTMDLSPQDRTRLERAWRVAKARS